MTQDDKKRMAAEAALEYVPQKCVLGIGTGSTVNHLIELLPRVRDRVQATVSSSTESSRRLAAHGFPVLDLNDVKEIPLYVDGADETDRDLQLIKGGGGALTREKIIAAVAPLFICMGDDSKLVDKLGKFPLPVEVIPMARNFVATELEQLGGRPVWRENYLTDNGNAILDVHDLDIADAAALETAINQLTGVVTNGLFARRPADILLLGRGDTVERIEKS